MREMKDSGIEWIGEIPKDWEIIKTKYVADISIGLVTTMTANYVDNLDDGVYLIRNGDIRLNKISKEKMVYISRKFVEQNASRKLLENDIVTVHTGYIGTSAIIREDFIGSVGFATIQSRPNLNIINERYLCWFYNSPFFIKQCMLHNTGDGRQNLNLYDFVDFYVYQPPLAEQQKIADFLDSKCSEIDATAEDIQKEIALLEDYKKSVITEAVTKGLDPDAEMKDSGIAWIGEIPKHWKVDKIKYHLKRNEPKNYGNAKVLSVYRDYGVIPKDSRDDNHNVTSEDTSKYKYVRKGQLVINKMKAWQGSLAVSDYDGIVSPAYFIYDFVDKEYNHKYFHYLVRSCYKEEFKRISGGIREGQWDLSPEGFSNTLVLLPSIEEQNEILDYILQKEIEINAIIADKKRQLDILAEYKKSLIYEYVTGKKEVPINE